MKPDYKLVAKAKYIHATADLASELWHEVYKRYYPAKQLDTLVDTLQSADAIEEDIDNDVNYFLVLLGGKVIGYFSFRRKPKRQAIAVIEPIYREMLAIEKSTGPGKAPEASVAFLLDKLKSMGTTYDQFILSL